MDRLQKTRATVDNLIQKQRMITSQISATMTINNTIEDQLNNIQVETDQVIFELDHYDMIAQLFYYDSFPMESMGVTLEQIQKMQKFANEKKQIIEKSHKDLISFAQKVIITQKKEELKKQRKRLEKMSAEEAQADVKQIFDDMHEDLKDGLRDIKNSQQEIHDALLKGDEKTSLLQQGIQENTGQTAEATSMTARAKEALNQNKDGIMLAIALVLLASGVVGLVFL